EQNATRAAKARETRKKRGTKGSRQKAAIKGADPASVTITPGVPGVIVTKDGSTPPPPPPPPAGH
ncbi:MAG TPA: hypothetical protein VFF73_13240, partial [Planctomycetota bacterium]|nr:hypothetical protein [Planctomycetota bacterium]